MNLQQRLVLKFALYEYIHARTPSRIFVDKQYPHMSEAFRDHKIHDIESNVAAAAALLDTMTDWTADSTHAPAEVTA